MNLSDATKIMVGANEASRIYRGSEEVWSAEAPPEGDLCTGGTPSASTPYSFPAANVFDNDTGTQWYYHAEDVDRWIQYALATPQRAINLRLYLPYAGPGNGNHSFKLYGSTTGAFAGEEVLLIDQGSHEPVVGWNTYTIPTPGDYLVYRIKDPWWQYGRLQIAEIELLAV